MMRWEWGGQNKLPTSSENYDDASGVNEHEESWKYFEENVIPTRPGWE